MPSTDHAPSEPTARRRTPRGLRTRDALVAAARRIFERDGYPEARIVDIAAEAGVATGSFYTHFASKDDVFAAVLAELRDEMLHAGVGGEDHRELRLGVEQANRAYLESYRRNAALMAAMEQAAAVSERFLRLRAERSEAFVERGAAAIARLQEAGLADPALDPTVAAAALSAMVSRVAFAAFASGEAHPQVPFETLVETLTRLWTNALRMPQE